MDGETDVVYLYIPLIPREWISITTQHLRPCSISLSLAHGLSRALITGLIHRNAVQK